MRRMIPTKSIEWIDEVKEKVIQNGNTTEIGGHLEVDGNLQVNGAFEQSEASWELDINSLIETSFASSNTFYSKFALYGNVLWLIISGIYVNGTQEDSNVQLVINQAIDIPDEVAEKVFRADGTSIKENPTVNTTPQTYLASENGNRLTNNFDYVRVLLESKEAKKISITLFGMGTHTEGNSYWIDIRIPLLIA